MYAHARDAPFADVLNAIGVVVRPDIVSQDRSCFSEGTLTDGAISADELFGDWEFTVKEGQEACHTFADE